MIEKIINNTEINHFIFNFFSKKFIKKKEIGFKRVHARVIRESSERLLYWHEQS